MIPPEPLQTLGKPGKLRRVNVLLNAFSGTTAGESRDELRNSLHAAFGKHDIAANLEFLPGDDFGSGAERSLQEVTSGEVDAIIVGGGDGSIRTGRRSCRQWRSAWDLTAWNFKPFRQRSQIPLAIDQAVGIIAAGETRLVDIGEANGKIFVFIHI